MTELWIAVSLMVLMFLYHMIILSAIEKVAKALHNNQEKIRDNLVTNQRDIYKEVRALRNEFKVK